MIDTLKPFKDGKYIPVEEALKQLQAYTPPEVSTIKLVPAPFPIPYFTMEELGDRFCLYNVIHRNGVYNIEWGKSDMCEGGLIHGDTSVFSFNDWTMPTIDMYYSSICALHSHPELRTQYLFNNFVDYMIEKLSGRELLTNTAAKYYPSGQSDVVFDKHPEGFSKDVELAGPNDWISPGSGLQEVAEALFGTRQPNLVATVGNYLGQAGVHLERLNAKPDRTTERAVTISIHDNTLVVNAKADPNMKYYAQAARCERVR
jgi:hypothetical protein